MDDHECHQTIKLELIKRVFSTRNNSPQFHINFNFFCKLKVSEWILHQDSTEPQHVREFNQPLIENFFRVNLHQFLCYEETHKAMQEQLSNLPMEAIGRRKLIEFAWKKAWENIKSKPTGHNVLHLNFHVLALHKHVFDRRSGIMNLNFQESDESCMVPALDSSIQSLKRKRMDSGNLETCSICLEDFSSGDDTCEALSMPCSHIFHGDCIKKWLRTSHYCPVCRFEMPTR